MKKYKMKFNDLEAAFTAFCAIHHDACKSCDIYRASQGYGWEQTDACKYFVKKNPNKAAELMGLKIEEE